MILDEEHEQILRRVLKMVLAGTVLIVFLELGFYFLAAPNLRLQHIFVTGDDRGLSNQGLLELLGLAPQEYYFSISDTSLEQRLDRVPWVRQAVVAKIFPDTLDVAIHARKPLAVVLTSYSGKNWVVSVDSQGVIFDVGETDAGRNLPILSGLDFQTLQNGMKLPSTLEPLLVSLQTLRKDAPGLFAQISEIRVRRTTANGFESFLYPVGGSVRIVLPEEWSQGLLQQAFVLLDVIKKQGWDSKTKELDFRTTPVVVRYRES